MSAQNQSVIYSDGVIEEKILEQLKKGASSKQIVELYPYGAAFHNFTSARENLINWYPFQKTQSVLEVGAGMGALTEYLCDHCANVTAVEMSAVRADIIRERCKRFSNLQVCTENIFEAEFEGKFDCILLVGVLEYAGIINKGEDPHRAMLRKLRTMLSPGGKLLVAIENRFGLKYWCGATEDHTGIPFDGIAGYETNGRTSLYGNASGVRTFGKEELEEILHDSGFPATRFFYPMPDYKFPTAVFSDAALPTQEDISGIKFSYSNQSTLIADERKLYRSVLENGVFPFFANSFFVEASAQDLPEMDIRKVLSKRDYKDEYRILTVFGEKHVRRSAAMPCGTEHIHAYRANSEALCARGLNVLDGNWTGDCKTMPILSAPRADHVFKQRLQANDFEGCLEMIRLLREALLKSSPVSQNGSNAIEQRLGKTLDCGLVLENGYIDLTLNNCFWTENALTVFDQEWMFRNIPLSYILYRAMRYAYEANPYFTQSQVLAWAGVSPELSVEYDAFETLLLSDMMDQTRCSVFDPGMYHDGLRMKKSMRELEAEINNQAAHIELLLQSERDLKAALEKQKQQMQEALSEQKKQLEKKDQELEQKTDVLNHKVLEIIRLEEQVGRIPGMENEIRILRGRSNVLDQVYASRTWRYTHRMATIFRKFFPAGSRRGRAMVAILRAPIRFEHWLRAIPQARRERAAAEAARRAAEEARMHWFERLQPLCFIERENPQVSIIIPVYNQAEYTYNCLRSIQETCRGLSYEVILADDNSTDDTQRLGEKVEGLHIVRNPENLRFLRNCNNAAKQARGEFLVFLNNDTVVHENWLQSLLNLMEERPDCGLAGSKLVFADGTLQEAGGIVWNNANAWNYGRGQDPENAEFNYLKEVDYISGCSIMIRASLWNEIGGFDERFAPAYCEDSDLAFEVRAHGFKVLYQPASVVTHFEGVSNGTDVSGGQKRYQAINREKFYEKWKEELKRQLPDAQDVFHARDRSKGKRCVLFIDHYVPEPDHDAGSRTIYQYLKLLAGMGYNVKFIGDNFYRSEPYTSQLQQLGVEVLYGPWYYMNWETWLRENGGNLDVVFTNRPHISIKYIEKLKQYTNAKIVYNVCDLHFLREQREYEITKREELLESIERWRAIETFVMEKADVVFTLSTDEKKIIDEMFFPGKACICPIFIYREEDYPPIPSDFTKKRDILFVGGFAHTPNVDSVEWFLKEVWPLITAKNETIRFHIVGSKMPEKLKKIAGAAPRVIQHGYVDDDELNDLYASTRIVIIPLLYGAGVKGKTIEAMQHGLPLVSTSVGVEGLENVQEAVRPTDETQAFADRVLELYGNPEQLCGIARREQDYVRCHYSEQSARELFLKIFG